MLFPLLTIVFLVGSAKFGAWLGDLTATPPFIWAISLFFLIAVSSVLPLEKFKKWPSQEELAQ
jgi:hypothetical protein